MRYTLDEIKYGTGFAPGAVFESVEKYNGWANRETWAVALHINNDQGWQESVHEALREADCTEGRNDVRLSAARKAGEIIRENVEDVLTLDDPNFLQRYGHQNEGSGSVTDYVRRVLPVVQDIGSLWRVDWTELGAAFLADLEELDR